MLIKGILALAAVVIIFIFGIVFLDSIKWGEKEGIVKTDNAGEDHDG